jgi:PKD repeat protein
VKGSDIIAPVFTKPGIYKIKLRVDTKRCGTDSVVKTICVEAPLVPKYDLDYTEGCAPMTVKVTNATDLSTTCSFTSSWSVAYTASYGGSLPVNWSFADGFSANGTNSGFVLKTPGTYKIRLTMVNAAGSYYVEKTVIVKQPPVLTINSIAAGCGVANIHPTATVNVCTPTVANVSYLWEFPGGTPSSMTSADPGFVKYNAPGVYTVKLTVTNECGSTTSSRNFTINNLPVISAIVSQHKKSRAAF